jgi:hypothetical protein
MQQNDGVSMLEVAVLRYSAHVSCAEEVAYLSAGSVICFAASPFVLHDGWDATAISPSSSTLLYGRPVTV